MKVTFDTRHLGEKDIDFAALTPAMQVYIIRYGLRQTIDDAGADPKKGADGSQDRLDAILAGHVPAGGGGRLTEGEKALRDVVEALLRRTGVKASEAVKLAREPRAAILKAFGDKAPGVWAKVQAKAAELVALRSTEIDLSE